MDLNISDFFAAIALVFVLEGLMPFLNPEGMRKFFFQASQLDNQTLRFIGLTSMLTGVLLLYIAR